MKNEKVGLKLKLFTKLKQIKKSNVSSAFKQILFAFLTFLILCYLLQIAMHARIDSADAKSKEAAIKYEKENNMDIINNTKDIEKYYTKYWSLSDGFDGFTKVHTVSTVLIDDETDKTKTNDKTSAYGKYALDVLTDKSNNKEIGLYTVETNEKNSLKYDTNIKIINKSLFLKLFIKSNDKSKDDFLSYMESFYNDKKSSCNIDTLTIVYDFIDAIKNIDTDSYDVTYNCRTKLKNKVVDDVSISFPNANYSIRVFVDSDTYKVIRIISCMISDNDYTDISYDKQTITYNSGITDKDKDVQAYGGSKIQKLSDGNYGCKLKDIDMATAILSACKFSSYGTISTVNVSPNSRNIESPSTSSNTESSDTKSSDTESSDNKTSDTESEVKNSGK